MSLTNSGRDFIAQSIVNATSPVFFDATNSYLAIGDSTTAFAVTQTDLVAVTNKLRKGMDATYPTRVANALVFKATFATGEANFAWNEWGIFNAISGGTMLNRVVANLGVKSSGTWSLTVTLTVVTS